MSDLRYPAAAAERWLTLRSDCPDNPPPAVTIPSPSPDTTPGAMAATITPGMEAH